MINLLPPQYKKEFLREESKRLAMVLGVLVSLSFVSVSLVLFSINIYLSGELESQETLLGIEKENSEVKEIKDLESQIDVSNKKLYLLDEFYSQKVSLTEEFSRVAKAIPQEIYLTDFSYTEKTSLVLLSGYSPSFDILFQFKKKLEENFQEVYFPPSSWIRSTDIDFSGVSFKVRK